LFIFSMLLLVLGSNYFVLFFGWEGVGMCSYLLISFHYNDAQKGLANSLAGRKAFIMNRIGDVGLLLALFMILGQFNTLEFLQIGKAVHANPALQGGAMIFITLCLFIAATGKSAQIPLFTWLPDAMAGPTPVSALIHAATMVTAGIYLTVRSNFLFELAPATKENHSIHRASNHLTCCIYGDASERHQKSIGLLYRISIGAHVCGTWFRCLHSCTLPRNHACLF